MKGRLPRNERRKATSPRDNSDQNNATICIWGSNHMDGQKNIWLQQIEQLTNQAVSANSSVKYSFTWILTTDESHVGFSVTDTIQKMDLRVNVMRSPLEKLGIDTRDFSEAPGKNISRNF
jgi:hypothetical protein